jgi:hypothetical protein
MIEFSVRIGLALMVVVMFSVAKADGKNLR